MALICGDCREALRGIDDCSVDSVVTDPPYELAFMGKRWDSTGVAHDVELWREVLRVLKPGGHLLAFGGTRTYHRMACAIEDAGFEIRDCLQWLYGSGFPKSHNISKAIDKAAGATREVVGSYTVSGSAAMGGRQGRASVAAEGATSVGLTRELAITKAATPEAQRWDGWGTALKPANEPIVMARKPFKGTVAANVLVHGTGGINVDACRVSGAFSSGWVSSPAGRWPANVIMDEAAGEMLDEQSGGASRFFYCAKASRQERELGLLANDGQRANRHPTVKPLSLMRWLVRLVTPPGGLVLDPFAGSGTTGMACKQEGFEFCGIEQSQDYIDIALKRIDAA